MIIKDWWEKPPAEVRSVSDALRDADRLRRELPLTVQVRASDWDKVILADEIYRLLRAQGSPRSEARVENLPPSFFVQQTRRYWVWCSVTVCPSCGLKAKCEDMPTANPCPQCGSRVKEEVGRWVSINDGTWWKLWLDRRWHWELREKV